MDVRESEEQSPRRCPSCNGESTDIVLLEPKRVSRTFRDRYSLPKSPARRRWKT